MARPPRPERSARSKPPRATSETSPVCTSTPSRPFSAQKFAYRDRRKNKSTFRQLWIVRLNAACRPLGISYSRLIAGLKKANITMDRKNLSELAIHDAPAFEAIVKKAQAALV